MHANISIRHHREVKAPKKNVWQPISTRESNEVQKWLRRRNDTNLSNVKNYAYGVELMPPNKVDVGRSDRQPGILKLGKALRNP